MNERRLQTRRHSTRVAHRAPPRGKAMEERLFALAWEKSSAEFGGTVLLEPAEVKQLVGKEFMRTGELSELFE